MCVGGETTYIPLYNTCTLLFCIHTYMVSLATCGLTFKTIWMFVKMVIFIFEGRTHMLTFHKNDIISYHCTPHYVSTKTNICSNLKVTTTSVTSTSPRSTDWVCCQSSIVPIGGGTDNTLDIGGGGGTSLSPLPPMVLV